MNIFKKCFLVIHFFENSLFRNVNLNQIPGYWESNATDWNKKSNQINKHRFILNKAFMGGHREVEKTMTGTHKVEAF